MYEYVEKELQLILENNFKMGKKGLKSICVQNMGGEALTIALCEGSRSWRSVSALTPICNPRKRCLTRRQEMAFDMYFVFPPDEGRGKIDDAAYVLASLDCSSYDDILIDRGSADIFMEDQCTPSATIAAAEECIQNKDSYFYLLLDWLWLCEIQNTDMMVPQILFPRELAIHLNFVFSDACVFSPTLFTSYKSSI